MCCVGSRYLEPIIQYQHYVIHSHIPVHKPKHAVLCNTGEYCWKTSDNSNLRHDMSYLGHDVTLISLTNNNQ